VEAHCYFGFYEPGVSTGPQPAGKVDVWAVQVGQVHVWAVQVGQVHVWAVQVGQVHPQ
jgi:hypothetical protein